MTVYNWLCLIGVPSIFSALVGILISKMQKSRKESQELAKKQENDSHSLKLGVQALLRAQMIADFNRWSERGYAPIYAKDNFENCWVQYENLGANGVMKQLHDDFLALPNNKPTA